MQIEMFIVYLQTLIKIYYLAKKNCLNWLKYKDKRIFINISYKFSFHVLSFQKRAHYQLLTEDSMPFKEKFVILFISKIYNILNYKTILHKFKD